tara:strand:- start:433 stop:786 length:354 start_codon:yes stop_codon:yes gene_type:complete
MKPETLDLPADIFDLNRYRGNSSCYRGCLLLRRLRAEHGLLYEEQLLKKRVQTKQKQNEEEMAEEEREEVGEVEEEEEENNNAEKEEEEEEKKGGVEEREIYRVHSMCSEMLFGEHL